MRTNDSAHTIFMFQSSCADKTPYLKVVGIKKKRRKGRKREEKGRVSTYRAII
jgi:hypothetical protein